MSVFFSFFFLFPLSLFLSDAMRSITALFAHTRTHALSPIRNNAPGSWGPVQCLRMDWRRYQVPSARPPRVASYPGIRQRRRKTFPSVTLIVCRLGANPQRGLNWDHQPMAIFAPLPHRNLGKKKRE
ncbi:hypothetical protein BC826DRAFT_739662 [Russula brevipes]|nr:hypothetical protein BC826DRAFT_739662 [Russula brevipes]